jgi:hypothetical protein
MFRSHGDGVPVYDAMRLRACAACVVYDGVPVIVENGAVVAQKVQTLFIDDLDGSAAEGTFRFGLDGKEYAVWRAYGIVVEAPSRNADVIHTSEMFFIDPAGRERYIAAPADDHTAAGNSYLPAGQLANWGQGIALVTRQVAAGSGTGRAARRGHFLDGDEIGLADQRRMGRMPGDDPAFGQVPPLHLLVAEAGVGGVG